MPWKALKLPVVIAIDGEVKWYDSDDVALLRWSVGQHVAVHQLAASNLGDREDILKRNSFHLL